MNEGILKGLKNIEDKNEELLNTFSTTKKAFKNEINKRSKNLVYSIQHCFAKFKNIADIKELSLNSMH